MSIRKPPADWGRESAAITVVRGAATGSVATVRAGGHAFRGIFLWGFAALWGSAALGAGAFGDLPTFFGVGLMALAAAWGGKRAFEYAGKAAGRPASTSAPRGAATFGGACVSYSSGRLITSAVICAVLSLIGWSMIGTVRGIVSLALYVAVPALVLMSVGSARKLLGDRTALRFDAHALTVATLWRRRTMRWSEVESIGVQRTETYAFGFLRTGRTDTLVIRGDGARLSLTPALLDLEGRDLAGLVAELEAARRGDDAPSRAQPAARPQPRAATPASDGAFDADAIIQRYLAEKAEAERHHAAVAPDVPIAGPQRRQFGRKVA